MVRKGPHTFQSVTELQRGRITDHLYFGSEESKLKETVSELFLFSKGLSRIKI